MSDNPYAAPVTSPDEHAENARVCANRRIVAPAIVLLLLAGLAFPIYSWSLGRQVSIRASVRWLDPESLLVMAINTSQTLSQAIIAIGAWNMLRLRSRSWALTAGWLSAIPGASSFFCLGIPFGIWALVALKRADVRAAFRECKTKNAGKRR